MGTATIGSEAAGVGKALLVGLLAGLTFMCGFTAQQLAHADLPKMVQAPAERRDIRCVLSDEKIASMKELDSMLGMRKGNLYVIVIYDLDGDPAKGELGLMYALHNGHITPFPVVYVFGDLTGRTKNYQVYTDQTGDGTCKGITLDPQEKLSVPENIQPS